MIRNLNKMFFGSAVAALILSTGSTVFAQTNAPIHAKKDFKIVGKYDEPICTDKDECEATGGTWSENLVDANIRSAQDIKIEDCARRG